MTMAADKWSHSAAPELTVSRSDVRSWIRLLARSSTTMFCKDRERVNENGVEVDRDGRDRQ